MFRTNPYYFRYFFDEFILFENKFDIDRAQNIPLCSSEYFMLKEFENMSEAERSFSLTLCLPLPLKQVMRPSCEKCSPYTRTRGAFLSLRWREENPN